VASSATTRGEIERLIPHRDPFLFVDRIVTRTADRIVCEWDVPADLDAFRGHYPAQPVLPGVLICELAFQSAACLLAPEAQATPGAVPVLTRIEDARFRRVVRPGETLRADVEVAQRVGPARYCRGTVACGGETVAQLAFTVLLSALER